MLMGFDDLKSGTPNMDSGFPGGKRRRGFPPNKGFLKKRPPLEKREGAFP